MGINNGLGSFLPNGPCLGRSRRCPSSLYMGPGPLFDHHHPVGGVLVIGVVDAVAFYLFQDATFADVG